MSSRLRQSLYNSYSSFASTSRYTLDHALPPPPPSFQELLPDDETTTTRGRVGRRTRRRNSTKYDLNVTSPQLRPVERTRSDPTQISPYLPQLTREKNYLLSHFRSTLHQATNPKRPSSTQGLRRKSRNSSGLVEQSWIQFVNLLRYPLEQVPNLPRSHFPTSTRAPHLPSHSSSSVQAPSIFDPSFPSPSPQSTTTTRPNEKIDLSLEELRQTFRIFASARPRTRTGLHRLLILVELISKHPKSGGGTTPGLSPTEEGDDSDGRLKGGGRGLRDREWRELLRFVGKSLRKVRPDPEVKSVLNLFTQREEQLQAQAQQRGRDSRGRGGGGGRDETRLYNTLLHIAQKSKMFELFDQILERMEQRGITEDGASFMARMQREEGRDGSIETVWNWFERGLRWTMLPTTSEEKGGKGTGVGKRRRKETRKVMWNLVVWILAKRGRFEDVERIVKSMKEGKTIDLDSLKPTESTSASHYSFQSLPSSTPTPNPTRSLPPLQVRPPSPDHRLYTSLVQSYSHQGELKSALLTLFEMVHLYSIQPNPIHFHHLFRSFVRFGSTSTTMTTTGEGRVEGLDWVSLRGIKAERDRQTSGGRNTPLSVLSASTHSTTKRHSKRSATIEDSSSTEFTLPTLLTIYESFLSLSPPSPSSSTFARLPFEGHRTAPSPQTIYFLLEAFTKLLGRRDSEVLLQVYERVERKFTNREKERDGQTGVREWNGWRMDKRVKGMVRGWKEEVEEKRRRLEELM
ncbi:uncharacterized protein JCM6883_002631 [Sporobolomyces salmoneus]|uniref:uncharacterized protein n=1 Tax=Sporobolomyces salmoneus TaxID=183962 RepID=UPI00317F6560